MAGEVDGENAQAALGEAPREQRVGLGIGEQAVNQECIAAPLPNRRPFAQLDGAGDGGDLDRAGRGGVLCGSRRQYIVAADAAVASATGERGEIDAAIACEPARTGAGARAVVARRWSDRPR